MTLLSSSSTLSQALPCTDCLQLPLAPLRTCPPLFTRLPSTPPRFLRSILCVPLSLEPTDLFVALTTATGLSSPSLHRIAPLSFSSLHFPIPLSRCTVSLSPPLSLCTLLSFSRDSRTHPSATVEFPAALSHRAPLHWRRRRSEDRGFQTTARTTRRFRGAGNSIDFSYLYACDSMGRSWRSVED